MAYDCPGVPGVGDVATVANWAQKVIDSLTYLKDESRLENGGADEISVAGLSGLLADQQTPLAHTIDKHTDVARTLFIPVMGAYTSGATVANVDDFHSIKLRDGNDDIVAATFMCPNDFVSITNFRVIYVSLAVQDAKAIRLQMQTDYGIVGEAYNNHGEDTGEDNYLVGAQNAIAYELFTGSFASLAKGDYCGARLTRHATDAQDTLNDDLYVLGFLLTYTAEQ